VATTSGVETTTLTALSPQDDDAEHRASRKWLGRLGWLALGAIVALVGGIATNVISWQLTEGQMISRPDTPAGVCDDAPEPPAIEGEELVYAMLQHSADDCWGTILGSVRPGDKFRMHIGYQNNTAMQQDNVSLRVILPQGFEYVAGSTTIANSTTGGELKPTTDGLSTVGFNAGSYQPRGNVFMDLEIRMTEALAPLCGVQSWAPTVKATTDHSPDGVFASAAVVTVRPACD
jgi:hypothetical protein